MHISQARAVQCV